MKYTIAQFNKDYPTDDACLAEVFANRYGKLTICPGCGVNDTKFYRVKKRKCYACMHCGHQLHPLAGTIFHKSETPLKSWFFAIYLFSNSKNGVSAKELERHLGVTYKTAWRIAKQIRLLMADDDSARLSGTVEVDETYIGGVRRGKTGMGAAREKGGVMGMVERKGRVKTRIIKSQTSQELLPHIQDTIEVGATVMTDQLKVYTTVAYMGYKHWSVNHSKMFGYGTVHTNTIEGFWGQLKRSLEGTYHSVSKKYLQNYVDEFAYRYNHRGATIYPLLVEAAAKPVQQGR